MAVVWIPAQMRGLTGDEDTVVVPGSTLRQVIDNLDDRFHGVKKRLIRDDHLSPAISVFIDGAIASLGLMEQVGENSEVSLVPAISGGAQ